MVPQWAEGAFAVVAVLVTVRAYLSGAARPTPEDRERAQRAGGILMLAGVALGSTVGGTIFAERSADDPAPLVAWLVLAAAALALTSGAALRLGAREPRKAQPSSVRGRARIHSLREGGPGVHGVPVWELGLEVTALGMAPFRTDVFAEVPRGVARTLEEGGEVTVLVEEGPSRKVTPDWTGDVETRAPYEGRAGAAEGGPPLASRRSISPLGWLARVLLPFALVALLANVTNRLFESEEGALPTAAPAESAGGAGGRASSPPGVEPAFSFTVPQGWRALPGEDRSPLRGIAPDVVLVRADGTAATAVAGRLRGVDASGRRLAGLLPSILRRLNGSVVPSTAHAVDGEPAAAFDLLQLPGVDSPAVAVVREGRVVIVAAIGAGDGSSLGPVVEAVVGSWTWR